MAVRRRTVIRVLLRALALVAAAALAVATVAAAALVPWPDHRNEAPSELVQPAESRQLRVCPGPLLSLGEDATAATTASSVGPADVVTATEPADAALEQVPLEAPGNPNAAQDGTPVAIAAEPGGVDAGMLGGAQSQSVSTETLRGFAAAACGEAVADAWLVAGATNLGRSGLVLLSNPTAVAATVDVRVVGEAGAVEAPSALGIIVPAGSQRVLSLAGLAPNLVSPVVHVTSTGGAIAATLEQSTIVGLAPAGMELTGTTAAPATTQVIPGLVVPQSGGVEAVEDHADGDDFPIVRLFAPGNAPVDVSIGVVPEGGSGGSTIEATLDPGRTLDVPLGVLDAGSYTVRVEADAPVVAAARASVGGTEGLTDAAAPSDFAWTVATSGSISRNDRAPLFQEWALVPNAVADGEWWRLLTGGFLHFGPIHLLFNMMALWVIGRDIEPALGRARFLAVYLVSLLGGSAAVMLLSPPNAFVAGASGAVFGLMGALAVLLRRLRIPLGQVGGLIVVNLVITFLIPGISIAGHIGGLLTGAIATAALVYAPADRRVPVQAAALGGLTVLLLAAIAFRMAAVI